MSTPFRLCLFGFAPIDEQGIWRMLDTPPARTPHYVRAGMLEQCDLVVANADNADALAELVRLELLDQTVYIGSDIDGEGWLKHPVDAKRLLHEVDRLALRQAPWYTPRTEPADIDEATQAPAAASGAPSAAGAREAKTPSSAAPASASAGAGASAGAPAAARATAPAAKPKPKPSPEERLAHTRALLVDDSEIALRFLETRLHRLGVATERATHSGRATELLGEQRFDFVLLDVELGSASELDGLALCQQIKRPAPGHSDPPRVILVSAHQTELDRARGALAGCDSYLGKPLDEALLVQTLAQHAPR